MRRVKRPHVPTPVRAAVLLIACGAATGCAGAAGGDWAGTLSDKIPEKLGGTTLGYDVWKLFAPDAPATPPPPPKVVSPYRPGEGPVWMTVWWQTADGEVHSEDRPASAIYQYPRRYAGALWVTVTPLGEAPKDVDPAAAAAATAPVEASTLVPTPELETVPSAADDASKRAAPGSRD